MIKYINRQKIPRLKPGIIFFIRRWQIAILLALFFLSPVSSAETIRMAWFVVPPHINLADDGVTPTGPTISLFNAIAARMGCSVEWVGPIPLNRLGTYQKTGQMNLDGTIMHVKTPAIIPYLYYPSQPYFTAIPSIAVRADNPLNEIRSIEDIKGYRIAFVKTYSLSYPPIIDKNREKVIIDDLTGDNWTSRNLSKLLSNRLDAVFERNQYTLSFQAANDNISDKIKIIPLPGDPILHYFVFQKNSPKGTDLLRRYEQATAGWNFEYDAMVRAEITRLKTKRATK